MMVDRFIQYPEVIKLVGVSKRQIQRWIAAGEFLQPVVVGRVRLFPLSEVMAFMENLKNQRKP